MPKVGLSHLKRACMKPWFMFELAKQCQNWIAGITLAFLALVLAVKFVFE